MHRNRVMAAVGGACPHSICVSVRTTATDPIRIAGHTGRSRKSFTTIAVGGRCDAARTSGVDLAFTNSRHGNGHLSVDTGTHVAAALFRAVRDLASQGQRRSARGRDHPRVRRARRGPVDIWPQRRRDQQGSRDRTVPSGAFRRERRTSDADEGRDVGKRRTDRRLESSRAVESVDRPRDCRSPAECPRRRRNDCRSVPPVRTAVWNQRCRHGFIVLGSRCERHRDQPGRQGGHVPVVLLRAGDVVLRACEATGRQRRGRGAALVYAQRRVIRPDARLEVHAALPGHLRALQHDHRSEARRKPAGQVALLRSDGRGFCNGQRGRAVAGDLAILHAVRAGQHACASRLSVRRTVVCHEHPDFAARCAGDVLRPSAGDEGACRGPWRNRRRAD